MMTKNQTPHPPIVSQDKWLAGRERLLAQEKRLTQQSDLVSAERRRLPMVRIEKDYAFVGPRGKQHLRDMFNGQRQLIVYHFMFDPKCDTGCPACTSYEDALGEARMSGVEMWRLV